MAAMEITTNSFDGYIIYPKQSPMKESRAFSLRQLFIAVTALSFVAWSVGAPSVLSCISTVVAWSLAGAVCVGQRCERPRLYAAAGGAAAVFALILCFQSVFLAGYFFYDGPERPDPYFEDGFRAEVFVYPFEYFVVYGPIGAVIGLVAGTVVKLFVRISSHGAES